ncbi:MAG: DMT family transporter [Eubacteriales bacterium]|nr:DMT family transporter [Eubacteriales bacterium]
MKQSRRTGHLAALFTIVIWSTTYIATKVLLRSFSPVEILFIRFVIGYAALLVACPQRLGKTTGKQELLFAGAGLCGVSAYYLLENVALTYTMASNVGVVLSAAPFFTAIVIHLFVREDERFHWNFLFGFLIALAGISLISFNGTQLQLNPLGDFLAVLAALGWAFYSLFLRRIGEYGFPTILVTRRIFRYGLLFLLPALPFFEVRLDVSRFAAPENFLNLIFLGFGASAICFVTWNYAVKVIGPVKSNLYIYLSPVITVLASSILLQEPVTPLAVLGTVLCLSGLVISEYQPRRTGAIVSRNRKPEEL